MKYAIAGAVASLLAIVVIMSCSSHPPAVAVAPPQVQYVDQPPAQQPVQVVQQPVYVQPQASTHDGLVEGMILGHMMSGGGGGGYGRAPTVVNHTTVNKTVVNRPAYRAPARSSGGGRRR